MSQPSPEFHIQKLLELGRLVRDAIIRSRSRSAHLAGVAKWTSADAIYELDTQVEPVIEHFCEAWSKELPMVLIAEGIGPEGQEGKAIFPRGTAESAAHVRIIMDPIDGTRGIMYDKRPAWFLAGIAPNKGDATCLSDIFAAVQVELPTSKQNRADVLWAVKGQGAHAQRERVGSDDAAALFEHMKSQGFAVFGPGTAFLNSGLPMGPQPLQLRPSTADNINHGFASISNFFPGTKELASRLMEEIARACVGPTDVYRATVFDDQYISTGGQFYELMNGHDRFIADLRPLFYKIQGLPVGMSAHPYDLCTLLIAREMGIELTDGLGGPLDGPLDVDFPLHWAGFANAELRARIEPIMRRVLQEWLNRAPSRPN